MKANVSPIRHPITDSANLSTATNQLQCWDYYGRNTKHAYANAITCGQEIKATSLDNFGSPNTNEALRSLRGILRGIEPQQAHKWQRSDEAVQQRLNDPVAADFIATWHKVDLCPGTFRRGGCRTDSDIHAATTHFPQHTATPTPTPSPLDLRTIPMPYRLTAAAWHAGIDLTKIIPRATLYRHAAELRQHGITINSKPARSYETNKN